MIRRTVAAAGSCRRYADCNADADYNAGWNAEHGTARGRSRTGCRAADRAEIDRGQFAEGAGRKQLKKRGKGLVAVPDTELPALKADQVRDTLERIRR